MLFSRCQGRFIRVPVVMIAPLVVASLLTTGCGEPGKKTPPVAAMPVAKPVEPTVDSVLDGAIKAYQDAKSYRDVGKIVLRAKAAQGNDVLEFDCHVEFQRPNLLRIEFQFADPSSEPPHVLVVSDGKRVYAKPEGFDNQVVVTQAPAKIEVPKFYEIEPLMRLLPQGITGRSFVLDMLTAEKPLAELDRNKAKLLETARIDGKPYNRVECETDQGAVVIWVNQQTSVVRRVEHPTKMMLDALKEQGVEKIELTSEFVDATLDAKIDPKRFTWEGAEGEHLVRQLVEPINPEEAPSKLLGKPVPEFKYTTAAGEQRDSKALAGKVTVIDFWATWCGFCLKGMPGVEEVRHKYADNDKVQFLAMSVDSPEVTNEQIIGTLKRINAEPPWARMTLKEPEEFYRMFEVGGIPAMAILAPDGTVQMLHIGMDAKIMENLPPKIDALLKGEDLAKKATEAWEVKQREFKRKLKEASVDAQATTIEIPRAGIAKFTPPRTFELVPLWTAQDVKEPGNVMVVAPQIYVIDQIHDIVELAGSGKMVARHKNLVPKDPPFTWMRTATDKQGNRYFVLGAVGQQQFHLFDGKWLRLLSYPVEGSAQVFDALPADLDGDGQLELCAGYFGQAGVQAASLEGKRLWSNRTIENVANLAVTEANEQGKRTLLCAHQLGTLVPIRFDGEAETPIRLPEHAVTHVVAADLDGDGHEEYCTLAADASGGRQIVGLRLGATGGGEFTWSQPIPKGEPSAPIESLTSGRLESGKPGLWIVAGADGSVHFFAADGTPVDQFNTGSTLTGLAATTIEGKPALLLAHPDKLQAFRVEKKL